MIRFPNFKEGMRMRLFNLALLAVVEIWADAALVSDSLERCGHTAIASYAFMYLGRLISCSLSKIFDHKSLKRLSGVRADLLLDNFN